MQEGELQLPIIRRESCFNYEIIRVRGSVTHVLYAPTMSFSQRDIATRETIPTPPQRYIPTPPDTQRAMSGTPSDVLRPTSTLLGELLTLAEAQVQARSHKPPRITCSTRYPPCPCSCIVPVHVPTYVYVYVAGALSTTACKLLLYLCNHT